MERRHIALSDHKTTISLEPEYWQAIEDLGGDNWRQWAADTLASKPEGIGRSSWLRCQVLNRVLVN